MMNSALANRLQSSTPTTVQSRILVGGDSEVMQQVMSTAERVATSSVPVLITGESGTGKELLARRVHKLSSRCNGPFVAVNCAALPRDLIESEFFGHERGSFTGASVRHIGRFERAHGGTLLLDEISELELSLQAKLLRVIQEREVERVGGSTPIRVDVRLIATTNKDLYTQVYKGLFREDLYYRLNVVPINIPPLRDRREDIPFLVEHFLSRHESRLIVSPDSLQALVSHDWPGNVRELENLISRLVILTDDRIDVDDLPIHVRNVLSPHKIPPVKIEPGLNLSCAIKEFVRRHISEALLRSRGNKQIAARLLGMKRTTLVAKMRRLGMEL